MTEDAIGLGPLDDMMKTALKRFKIGGRGIAVVIQKGRAGPEFKFRPVYYDFSKDTIVLHHKLITEKVKRQRVPGDRLLNYIMHFGVGMAAEIRRMSTSGICPLFNFVESNLRRKWYKMHWTRLENEAEDLSEQLIEFMVDKYLNKIKIGNPVPVGEHTSYLKKLRKGDVSRFHKELLKNLLSYLSRAKFSSSGQKERDLLERFTRSAAGPERWFHLNRALKKVKFGQPETYKEGYPAVAEAVHPEVDVVAHETTLTGLPERESLPKVWKATKCTYFEWKMKKKGK